MVDAYANRENWYILLVSILTGKGQEKAAKLIGEDDLTGRSVSQKARRKKPRSYYQEREDLIYHDYMAGQTTRDLCIKYGIDANSVRLAVRRYCERHNIERPTRLYEMKNYALDEYQEDCEEWQ